MIKELKFKDEMPIDFPQNARPYLDNRIDIKDEM
jgi:hypothetical protein